jgi:sodium-dependent dicarboxylate transporter 2/3/5
MRIKRAGFFLGILGCIVCYFIPITGLSPEGHKVACCGVLIAVWWMTEAIPTPATSLLPLVLFPLLKIADMKTASAPYANPLIFLLVGGFFIARAMERHNLHKRLALYITLTVGTEPRRLILGFMLGTAFVSMWVSNTASTMMMIPVALAVLSQLSDDKESRFGTALTLGVAYSASVGGIGTLIGTTPQPIFAGQARELMEAGMTGLSEVTFLHWLFIGLPLVILFIPIIWLYLVHIAFPVKKESLKKLDRGAIAGELEAMGPMSKGERMTFAVFLLTAFLWIFRKEIDVGFAAIPGWSDLLGLSDYVGDGTVAIAGALLLFILPLNFKRGRFVLDWDTAYKIPWGVVLLLGGGFSLAHAFQLSGLSLWVGSKVAFLGGLPVILLIASIALMMTFLTELTSNTATSLLLLPILAGVAQGIGIHPYLLMVPAAISASCAFMLPVGTPPNAIAYAGGYIRMGDMVKAGFVLNLVGILLTTLVTVVFAARVFGI